MYVGLTETTFKTRYNNHKLASFTNLTKRNATEMSKHIWDLKNKKVGFDIKWKALIISELNHIIAPQTIVNG